MGSRGEVLMSPKHVKPTIWRVYERKKKKGGTDCLADRLLGFSSVIKGGNNLVIMHAVRKV